MRPCIFNQDDCVALFVYSLMSCCGHVAIFVNRECDIGCYQIAFRRDGLTQGVFLAHLQLLDNVVAALDGCPGVNHIAFAVGYDQLGAFDFLAIGDVGFLDFNVRPCIFNQNDSVAILISSPGAGHLNLAGFVDPECDICRNCVALGSHSFTQCVLVRFAGLQTFDDVIITGSNSRPGINFLAVLVKNNQCCARDFFAVRNVGLLHFDVRLPVVDNQHFNAVFALAVCTVACNVAVFIDAEGRIAGDGISIRCNRLTQRVGYAGLQAFNLFRCVTGHPGPDNRCAFQDLQRCTRQFFIAIGGITLADRNMGLAVVHHQHGITVLICAGRAAALHLTLAIDTEDRIAGNGVAIGSDGFTQSVLNARLQAGDFNRLVRRYPCSDNVAFRIQNLQGCAGQLIIARDILLAHLHICIGICDGVSPFVFGNLLNVRCDVSGNLRFSNSVLNFSAVCILLEIRPGVLPLVLRIQLNRACFLSVCQQLHCHVRRTEIALVVAVVPDLFNADLSLFFFTAVRHRVGEGTVVSLGDQRAVVLNLFFSDGIVDRLAAFILLQFSPGLGPFVRRIQYDRIDLRTVLHQVDGNAFGAEAFSIVIVIPDLQDGNFSLLIVTAVRDSVCPCVLRRLHNHRRLVVCKFVFRNGVGNFFTAGILLEIIPGVLPLVLCIQRRGAGFLAVCQQLHCHALRTEAFLIIVVVPDLFNADLGLFFLTAVRHRVGEGAVVSLGDQRAVVFNLFFSDGIVDCLTADVLLQFSPGLGPVVCCIQHDRIDLRTVLQQVDGNAFGPESFSIVIVFPDLGNADFSFFVFTAVCYRICEFCISYPFDNRCVVTRYLFFGNGVDNLFAVIELGQSAPGMRPVVRFIQFSAVYCLAALHELDSNLFRPEAFLIIIVIPDLFHVDLGFFCDVLVGNSVGKGAVLGFFDRGGILFHRVFGYGVVDIRTADLLLQVDPGVGPLVLGIQRNRLAGFLAVRQQLDRDFLRLITILVVSVVPDLCHLAPGLFGCVLVGNIVGEGAVICPLNLGGIICHRLFSDSVFNSLSGFLLRQFRPAVSPAVGRIQNNRFQFRAVGHQVHSHAGRTIAILVIVVFPLLRYADFGLAGNMRVRQGIAEVSGGVLCEGNILLIAVRYFSFIHCVFDLFTLFELIQLGPLMDPVVALIQFNRCTDSLSVSFQLYADTVRTDTILILVVFPFLLNGNINLTGLMFIGKRISEVARVVLFERYSILVSVRHRGFFHTVDDLFAILILVKVIPGVSPAVLLAQSYGVANLHSVSLQLYADAGRLHAVLVLFVIPDLFNRNLDLFSLVLVGNSIAVVARAVLFERYVLCVSRRHFNFIHTVDNRRTVLVFVQSGPLMAPLIILVQRYGIADIGAAILELHRHAVRLLAVLVVLVIPDLFNGDLHLFRFMGVGNGIAVVSVVVLLECDVLCIASGNSRLIYAVGND